MQLLQWDLNGHVGINMNEPIKVAGDIVSGSVVVASLAQWIPWILAIPGSVYACLRIYEWFENRRKR